MTDRYLETTPATAAQQNARLWTLYDAEQRAARGLRPTDSLDTRAGVPVPLAQAVTNGTNGYALLITSDDGVVAALPLDDFAVAAQGRGGVDVRGHKDEASLDARIRTKLAPATRLAAPPLGNPRTPR